MKSFLPWFSLLLVPFAYSQKLTTFDVPGGTSAFPTSISQAGEIVGYYQSPDTPNSRGFVRKADGKFVTFDAAPSVGTLPGAENLQGQIAGSYAVAPDFYVSHGFVRDAHGRTTLFAFPGPYTQTLPTGINSHDVVAGGWISYDSNGQNSQLHGFLREPDGTLTSIEIGADTWISAINAVGQTVGFYDNYTAAGQEAHGFLRNANGLIANIDILNATSTFPVAINSKGQVAGSYLIFDLLVQRGFLRDPDGTITTFSVPGAIPNSNVVVGIDSKGRITGIYQDEVNNLRHGFLRGADGTIATIDVPGARETLPMAINPQGVIVGTFIDSLGKQHGFLLNP